MQCLKISKPHWSSWTLHAKYKMENNEYLPQIYRGRKMLERSKSEHNNIEEAVIWVNYIEK